MDTPPPTPEQFAETEGLRQANRTLLRQLASAKASQQELVDAVYKAAKDAAVIAGPGKPLNLPKDRRRAPNEVALWHLTDWQGGKRTSSYDLDVMEQRVASFTTKALQITAIHRSDHPVRDCVIALGGDMVEGVTVFPGQAFEVDASLFDQMFRVATLIERTVRTALAHHEHVTVICEYGNHGRIGRRGDVPRADNIDRMVYAIVARRFEMDPRCLFQTSDGWYQSMTIGEYKAMLVHGDEVKSFGGNVPAFGILRKVNSWATGVVPAFTDAYMGHWHTPMTLTLSNGGRVFVTGSTESGNIYAQEFVGALGLPSQRLHFINPVRGRVTAEYTIWLDE